MVFPEIGKADYELTASVLGMLTPPKNGIQLARHSMQDIVAIKREIADRTYTTVSGIQTRDETVEDWRYPVRIFDTALITAMEGRKFKNIRNKFRTAAQNIEAIPLEPGSALSHMRAALKFWEGTMIANQKDHPNMSGMYEELFRIAAARPESVNGLYFCQGKRPVGLSIWDTPYADTANLVANLSDTSVTGLSEFQVVSACRTLDEQGVKYLNRGGSEREGLDDFKVKFNPVKTVKILSAEVTYHKPVNDNIEITTMVPSAPLALDLSPSL